MKRIILILALLALGASWASTAAAQGPPDDAGVKVFVCKYIGTPGADERLQTGQNPIDVSVNAIPDYAGVGSYFADAQGRSYVLGPEHAANENVDEPDVSLCPGGDPPPGDPPPADPGATIGITCDEITFAFSGFPEGTNVVELDISIDGASSFSDRTEDVSFEGPSGEASVSLDVAGEVGVQAHATWLAGEGGQASLGAVLECEEHSGTTGGTTTDEGGSSSTRGGTTGGTTAVLTSGELPHTGFDVWIPLTFAGGFLALGFSLLYGPRLLARWRSR